MFVAVINDIPGTIDIYISKTVSVIPFFYSVVQFILLVIVKHIFHFSVREAKAFIKHHFGDRKYFKIIQSRKNAFFCNAKATCKNCKFETIICF